MGAEKQSETRLSDFSFRPDGHVESCPAGHEPVTRKKKKSRFSQGFAIEACRGCPRIESCPTKKGTALQEMKIQELKRKLAACQAQ
jgi:hypothetical protein